MPKAFFSTVLILLAPFFCIHHSQSATSVVQCNSRLSVILSVLDYDLGYGLQATADRLKKKTGRIVSPSTITAWLNEHRQHCSYRRLPPPRA